MGRTTTRTGTPKASRGKTPVEPAPDSRPFTGSVPFLLLLGTLALSWPADSRAWLDGRARAHEADLLAPIGRVERRVGRAEAARVQRAAEIDAIADLIRDHRRRDDAESVHRLAEAIHDEAIRAGVDPLLVAAVVAKESSFRTRAVSRAGAVGLMQLRPFVARDVALRLDLSWKGPTTLRQPHLNVRLGAHYLRELMERFDGDPRTALTAYNFGPTRVRSSLRRGADGTSRYASEILRLYRTLSAERAALLRPPDRG